MKITLEGDLTNFLRDMIAEDIITMEELNGSVSELNEEWGKKHYSHWVGEENNLYHCHRCSCVIYHLGEDGFPDTCPCCGAHMVKPKCRCDKSGGKR